MSLNFFYENAASPDSILSWLTQFPYHTFLQSFNNQNDKYSQFEWIAAWATESCLKIETLAALDICLKNNPEKYWFGGFSYSLIESIEPNVKLKKKASIPFSEVFLFAAEGVVLKPKGGQPITHIFSDKKPEWSSLFNENQHLSSILANPVLEYSDYQQLIKQVLDEIYAGNTYELNLTCEFLATGNLAAKQFYRLLSNVSQAPFTYWFAWNHKLLIGSSPERFLAKRDQLLIAQPIKGTIAQKNTLQENINAIRQLQSNDRFQAENVMIVDLMRNDFYRICLPHSVEVPQLFAVQTLNNLFHLYSTITGICRPETTLGEIIRAVFPTGSMTGAPKIKTIQLIDNYEVTGRSAYSGSLGYILPGGDFDFAVVIRTLIYEALQQQISFHVGGAIIAESDPIEEWNELLLKANNIQQCLRNLTNR